MRRPRGSEVLFCHVVAVYILIEKCFTVYIRDETVDDFVDGSQHKVWMQEKAVRRKLPDSRESRTAATRPSAFNKVVGSPNHIGSSESEIDTPLRQQGEL